MKKIILTVFVLLFLGYGISYTQNLEDVKKGKVNFELNGALSLTGGSYLHWGTSPGRNNPYIWNLNGGISLSIFGIRFPFSFNVGNQQRGFTQPFNQYGVSPYYKWITAHLGWRSMQFSPFVMQGTTFLGGGLELNPKNFRFAAFYGRLNKATANDTSGRFYPLSVFDRWAYGAKIGVGNQKNYFDIMFLKSKDDTTTKKSAGTAILPGQDNLNFGIGAQFTFLKRLTFKLDVGASMITFDLGTTVKSQLPSWLSMGSFFKLNSSTAILFAGQSSLGYQDKHIGLKLIYQRVDPNYTSHGITYRQGDVEQLTLEPSFNFWKGKIRLFGSGGLQHDNLLGRKAFATWRTIGSVNLSLNPVKQYGFDFNFSNYGITQRAGMLALNDTFRIAQNNRTFGMNHRFNFTNKIRAINVMLSGTFQQLIDLNRYYGTGNASEVIFACANASYIRMKSGLMINLGGNMTSTNAGGQRLFLVGPSVGFGISLFKKKVNINLGSSYNMSISGASAGGKTVSANIGFNYRVNKTHSFLLNGYFLNNQLPGTYYNNITELRMMGGYTLTFNFKPRKKSS